MRYVKALVLTVLALAVVVAVVPVGVSGDADTLSGRAFNDDVSVSYTSDPYPVAFIDLTKKPSADIALSVYNTKEAQSIPQLPGDKSLAVELKPLSEGVYTFLITDAASGATVATIDVPIGHTQYYLLSYSANGGSGSMNPTMAEKGEKVTLSENGFTAPDGKEFKAWAIDGKEYAPGDSLTLDSDVTATAVWKDKSSDSPVLWIAIGAVIAVIAVGALVFVVLKRRKVTE